MHKIFLIALALTGIAAAGTPQRANPTGKLPREVIQELEKKQGQNKESFIPTTPNPQESLSENIPINAKIYGKKAGAAVFAVTGAAQGILALITLYKGGASALTVGTMLGLGCAACEYTAYRLWRSSSKDIATRESLPKAITERNKSN